MPEQWIPLHFIGDAITVEHKIPPPLLKKPDAPDSFIWKGQRFLVAEKLSAWVDYARRGRMARNMQPQHLNSALRRGSWGVGRFYFRVRTEDGRCFDLYYDRAPEEAGDRGGHWFLYRELQETTSA